MPNIGGVKSVRIDSYTPDVGDSVTITPNNVTRTSQVGLTGYAGTSEVHRPARIELEIIDTGDTPIATFTALTDATISVVTELKTFVLRNAAFVEDVSLDQSTGRYTLAFEGPSIREF